MQVENDTQEENKNNTYITREVTDEGNNLGKLILTERRMKYPQLVKHDGSMDNGVDTPQPCVSHELNKSRTKQLVSQGSSMKPFRIDFELTLFEKDKSKSDFAMGITTFDDLQEAALRGRWTRWRSDTKSPTNKDSLKFSEGMFYTRALVGDKANFGQRRLVTKYNANGTEDKSVGGDDIGLFKMPKGAIVNELTTGNNDVKYAILKRYGGKVGEDLWQEFLYCAVNQMSLTIPVGAIITGTFNMMGTNDPNLPDTKAMIKALGGDTRARFLDGATTGRAFIRDLPEKSTDTDQYTLREGFLYVNGENIEFADSLDFTLDNGMEQKKAIHVRNAIATVALKLDITGNLKTYLVKGADKSEMLFNLAQSNGDVEILDCVHNDEDNPRDLYVFQIFTAKFTEHGIDGSGADTMEMSLPFSSYGERALRIFKIAMPVPVGVRPRINADGKIDGLYLALNVIVDADDEDGVKERLTITADVNGTSLVRGATGRSRAKASGQMSVVDPQDKDPTNEGCVLIPLDRALEEGETLHIVAEMSGKKVETSIPAPVTFP